MLVSWLLATSCAAGALAQDHPKPNDVLLIVLDDVGVDLVGAYETYYRSLGRAPGTPASTPAIDNLLAARGVTFTSVWTCPKCSPSRAQMLTGRYAFRSGLGQVVPEAFNTEFDNAGLSRDARLLPEVLHAVEPRYECAAVGKWHLVGPGDDDAHRTHPLGDPPGRWFDLYAGSLFNLTPASNERSTLSLYSNWAKTYATAIRSDGKPCGEGKLPCTVPMNVPPLANYATVDTADDAIALVGTMHEPWFLYVAFNAPHAPVHDVPPGLPRASCEGYEAPKLPCDPGPQPSTPMRVRCMLAEADAQIARLLCSIDASKTTVLLIGDNGTASDAVLPPFGSSHSKQTLYEGGVHVPLIVRWPGAPHELAGTTCDALVSSTDLFASIAELAGTAGVADDSVSFVPYLHGRHDGARRTVYVEEFRPNFTPDPKTGRAPESYRAKSHGQALRDARFKLIRTTWIDAKDGLKHVEEEFYDLLEGGPPDASANPPRPTRDFFEHHDLLKEKLDADSAAARALAALRAELDHDYPSLVR